MDIKKTEPVVFNLMASSEEKNLNLLKQVATLLIQRDEKIKKETEQSDQQQPISSPQEKE